MGAHGLRSCGRPQAPNTRRRRRRRRRRSSMSHRSHVYPKGGHLKKKGVDMSKGQCSPQSSQPVREQRRAT